MRPPHVPVGAVRFSPRRKDDVRDHELIRRDVASRLRAATTVKEACDTTVTVIGAHTGAMAAVLLPVRDRLRCVAATGAWQIFTSLPPGAGVSGRVYRSGKAETLTAVDDDPDYIPFGRSAALEVCVPLKDAYGAPIGVLNLEWSERVSAAEATANVEAAACDLAERIAELGGPPPESRTEQMLRHAGAITTASSQWELLSAAYEAARDISGLSATVLIGVDETGLEIGLPTTTPPPLEQRIRDNLAGVDQDGLRALMAIAHRHGASYTLGEADLPAPDVYAPLAEAGVRTLISVPVGPPDLGGVILIADDRTLRPDPSTVNVMELLATQAWACNDRLRSLAKLHEQAMSDPLTGLRHQGPFNERIAGATPGRTALLAIDIDQFKLINDTYGHQEGDQVLVTVARALQTALRHGDELYRLGGDEFVAVVDVIRDEEAVGIAERLTAAARAIGRTVSVGVAIRQPDESPQVTLRRADRALYVVKRDGRDGVRLAAA
jgi:diguanylate cyclase (GGDEF)-like protein